MVNTRVNDINQSVFTDWLKKEINARELSYRNFAKLLGINVSYLSLILSGKRNPSMEFIFKLTSTLNISFSFLLSITGYIPNPPLTIDNFGYFEYIKNTLDIDYEFITKKEDNLDNLFYLWNEKKILDKITIDYLKLHNKIIRDKQYEYILKNNLSSIEVDFPLFFKYHITKDYLTINLKNYIYVYPELLLDEGLSIAFQYAPNIFILHLCRMLDIEDDLFFFLTGRYRKDLLIKLPIDFRKKISNYIESLKFTEKVRYAYRDYKSRNVIGKETNISDEFWYYIDKYFRKGSSGPWGVFYDYYSQLKIKTELFNDNKDNLEQNLVCNIEQPFSIVKKGNIVQVILNLPEKEYFTHVNTINTLCSLCTKSQD